MIDYGDSFTLLFDKYGLQTTVIRLTDKLLRLEALTKKQAKVKGETIEDSIIDIAVYSIMTLMELRKSGRK